VAHAGVRLLTEGARMNDTDLVQRIEAALEASGVEHEIFPCDPELADTAVFCERYGFPLDASANTILVKAKTGGERFVVCVVLANTRLDVNRTVRKRLGARRVSFASAQETRAATGMEIGGVTPLALPGEIEVWVDARVMACEWVILGGGDRSHKIKVAPALFERIPSAIVIEGLALDPPA
jgi:prolyl-tRNA editing enzyme YbaK/EbsC (Cys-tRNA(Pro) deacylase)